MIRVFSMAFFVLIIPANCLNTMFSVLARTGEHLFVLVICNVFTLLPLIPMGLCGGS